MTLRHSSASASTGQTEFDILKASHRFLREDASENGSWNDRLAQKYYSSLYREFAVCDLKHYKSGNFALRWRTESEVLSGAGESTCGNTRCRHHEGPNDKVPLTTLELPFSYIEHGEGKSALVKVVLCGKCYKKLMWKREREKEQEEQEERPARAVERGPGGESERVAEAEREKDVVRKGRRRNSRSLSPRRGLDRPRHRRRPS